VLFSGERATERSEGADRPLQRLVGSDFGIRRLSRTVGPKAAGSQMSRSVQGIPVRPAGRLEQSLKLRFFIFGDVCQAAGLRRRCANDTTRLQEA
jgi:hypothetical protein